MGESMGFGGLGFLQAEQTQHRVWRSSTRLTKDESTTEGLSRSSCRALALKAQAVNAQVNAAWLRPHPFPRGAMSHGRRKVNTQLERSRVLERVRSRPPCTARREPINLAFEPRPQLSGSLAPDIPIVPFAPCGLIVTYRPDR